MLSTYEAISFLNAKLSYEMVVFPFMEMAFTYENQMLHLVGSLIENSYLR